MKIYCASDFHLGFENANYNKILSFLDLVKNDADQLIILGDIYDAWRMDFSDIIENEPMKSCHETLLDTISSVPVIYCRGNHDYTIKKHLKNIKIRNHYEQDNIYYCHGHAFDIAQLIGYPYYQIIADYFPSIYQKYFRTPFETVSDSDEYTAQIRMIDEAARNFAERKGYSKIVMGHTHLPEVNGVIVNCGDFIGSNSFVVIEEGIPELRYI